MSEVVPKVGQNWLYRNICLSIEPCGHHVCIGTGVLLLHACDSAYLEKNS